MAKVIRLKRRRRRQARGSVGGAKGRTGRPTKVLSNKIHLFKKKAQNEVFHTLSGSTSSNPFVDIQSSDAFQFDKIVNYTDLANNYDRYQIKGVQVKFSWSPSVVKKDGSNQMNGANDQYAPHIRYHVDYDDSGTPSWAVMGADSRTKTRRILPYKPVSIFVRPKVAVMMYQTAVATGYGPKRSPPINTTHPNVPHYGLKYVIRYPNLDAGEISADSQLGQVMVEYTYYVKMMYPQT